MNVKQALGHFASWKDLGLNVGLDPRLLEVIGHKQTVSEQLHQVLLEWLKMNYNLGKYGCPTWDQLARAVDPIDHAMAIAIREKYPSSST